MKHSTHLRLTTPPTPYPMPALPLGTPEAKREYGVICNGPVTLTCCRCRGEFQRRRGQYVGARAWCASCWRGRGRQLRMRI